MKTNERWGGGREGERERVEGEREGESGRERVEGGREGESGGRERGRERVGVPTHKTFVVKMAETKQLKGNYRPH